MYNFRVLLQRVINEKRIRHDQAYPIEAGPHHCEGCVLNELILEALADHIVRHMSDMGAIRAVCGEDLDAKGNSMVVRQIDDVDCVNCLRMLAKDAGRYGNARQPRR